MTAQGVVILEESSGIDLAHIDLTFERRVILNTKHHICIVHSCPSTTAQCLGVVPAELLEISLKLALAEYHTLHKHDLQQIQNTLQ